ncbi:hypothetical protein FHX05_005727 [Rhizobium sp. BK491]|nr:hypothetical protein [Rhizobium sp. BK491]
MSKAGSRILHGARKALVFVNDKAEDKPVMVTVAQRHTS